MLDLIFSVLALTLSGSSEAWWEGGSSNGRCRISARPQAWVGACSPRRHAIKPALASGSSKSAMGSQVGGQYLQMLLSAFGAELEAILRLSYERPADGEMGTSGRCPSQNCGAPHCMTSSRQCLRVLRNNTLTCLLHDKRRNGPTLLNSQSQSSGSRAPARR